MLSVVLPCYNEGHNNIERAYQVIKELLEENNILFEMLFINDGSRDDTWDTILKISESDSRIRGVNFSRNFGKESALLAGLSYATGDCCVTIDCDLQHPPNKIIEMYELWEQGFEVIEGIKRTRGKEGCIHKLCAKLFYALINKATKSDMSRASDYKMLDRKAIAVLLSLPERQMFYRALTFWTGLKKAEVEFDVNERLEGKSKWSVISLIKYAIKNITSFSTAPMQIVTIAGTVFFVLALIIGVVSVFKYMIGDSLEGFTTVILLILILGSILMLSVGIIGYYIAKIYEEIKMRPRYIVEEICGNEKN